MPRWRAASQPARRGGRPLDGSIDSSPPGRTADDDAVRLQRLVLHAPSADEAFTLDLHPRLTVVSGAGRLEREGLVNEILGALGSSRPGVHLELTDDDDRSLAVFRPVGA